MLQADLNPILDEGAPVSSGGTLNAARLADQLGIEFKVRNPERESCIGWGQNCADAKTVICIWNLTVLDNNGKSTELSFELVEGESPLIVGLDTKEHADTLNRSHPRKIIFQRPCDRSPREMYTYIAEDETKCRRLRLEIIPHTRATARSLMGNVIKRPELNMAKKIHRFTHAHSDEMKMLFKDAGMLTPVLKAACEKVHDACEICVSSGEPKKRKKISLTHVNSAFNEDLTADFVTVRISGEKYEVLNIVDAGTRYGERVIASSRNSTSMQSLLETEWLYHHGAPKTFSADPEFCKPVFERFLRSHNIELRERPSRTSWKNGLVERNNGTFKRVLDRIARENTTASPSTLVARASMMTNVFHGSSVMSSFQLARGYAPSLAGVPSNVVPQELLDAQVQMSAARAVQRLLKAQNPPLTGRDTLPRGTLVWVYYNTSKQNEPVGWVRAVVESAGEHVVRCRRSKRGPPMMVAYEHIRLAPTGELARDMTEGTLESCMESVSVTDASVEWDELRSEDPEDIMREIFGEDSDACNNLMMTEAERGASEKDSRTMYEAKHGEPEKDIGVTSASGPKLGIDMAAELQSTEQEALADLYKSIVSEQVSYNRISPAPSWLVEKAVYSELRDNWEGSYNEVYEVEVPSDANVVFSHFVFKIKIEENGHMRLKARLCPHGNRDKEKGNLRKDASVAQFDVIRLLLSLATILQFSIGCVDIKGAYLQSGAVKRRIYVRPPRQWTKRGLLWLLTKLPYGFCEAGRQWAKSIEGWMLEDLGLERVFGVSQLYAKRDKNGRILFLLAKLTDDLLMAGSDACIREFTDKISKQYTISKSIIDAEMKYNGCIIRRDEHGTTSMSMESYVHDIRPIHIDSHRETQADMEASDEEVQKYRALAGELVWLGCGVMPQAATIGSLMQQRVPRLQVKDLMSANRELEQLRSMPAVLTFRRPEGNVVAAEVLTFSDASFNISPKISYGQSGIVAGILYTVRDHGRSEEVYHMVDWASIKQRRVSYSSYGAEILACADADDRSFYLKMSFNSIFPSCKFKSTLVVDSKGLYDTITTLHQGREYRLRQTVQRLRDSFESQEMDALRWIQGHANISDALTKNCPRSHAMLNEVANTATLSLPHHRFFELKSATWV